MPDIGVPKQTFEDPIVPLYYSDIVVQSTPWSSVAGFGTPENSANVTGDHIFRQASQPTITQGAKEGDIWYDSDDSNHPYKLVSGTWTSIQDTGVVASPGIGGWVNNLVFSVTDYNTLAWGAGTIALQDGTTYSINAGDTANIAAVTYIFLDTDVSVTTLQTTMVATSAVGVNRILVAVASPNADTAKDVEYQVFAGFGNGVFITADNIAANTITANEIAANTITANKMNVSILSAISADLGTITAGTITGGTFQTSASATVGIKFDSTSLRGYNGSNVITFELNPATGVLTASAVILTGLQAGSSVDGQYLSANSVASAAANLALRGWTQTCAFSVTDADTVAWGAGSFVASDGTTYSIGANNTGNMVAKTYIYLDIAVSVTEYQTTTTATTAIGNGKVLVAIAQNATAEATFMLLNNNSYNIDAANIIAGSITANEIAASTITAAKLTISTLSAISADLGTITAGTITGATIQTASSGARVVMTSTSLQGINAAGAVIFEVVISGGDSGDTIMGDDSTDDYAKWDNSAAAFIGKGQISHQMSRTAGIALSEGEVVAVESDGKVYPCRVSDIPATLGSDTLTTTLPTIRAMTRVTSSVVFSLYKRSANSIEYARIALNSTFDAISSITNADATSDSAHTNPHVIAMTATSAMGCYELASSTSIIARMYTGLDTGVTTNTEYTIDSDATKPMLVQVSATQALIIYREVTTADLKVRKLDLSGTVISAGAETNIYTGTVSIQDFVRFGTSEYYCVIFTEGGSHKAICFQWDGATFTAGTEITIESSVGDPRAASIDSTRIAITGLDGTANITTQVVSRSGTTLTANAAIDVAATTDSPSGTVIAPLGADSYILFYAKSVNTAGLQLIRVSDTTVTELGSERSPVAGYDTSNNSSPMMNVVKVAPNLVLLATNSAATTQNFELFNLTNNYDGRVGVPIAAAAADASVRILMNDYSDNFTGLTTAIRYFVDVDGALTTEDYAGTSPSVGVALSATEMDIQI